MKKNQINTEKKKTTQTNQTKKNKQMRKAEFAVPSELMTEFADKLASHNLNNTITGTNDECEVLVEVEYERGQHEDIDELEEYINDLREKLEEEEEEEENE